MQNATVDPRAALAKIAYFLPRTRFLCSLVYNTGWFGGSVPAAAVCFGTQYLKTGASWRIPIALQAFAALIVMVAVFFIRE